MEESLAYDDPQRIEMYYKTIENLRREDIDVLRDWIRNQPHLPNPSDVILIYGLHSCYYDMEAAKKCLDNFFTYRAKIPEVFGNRNPLCKEIERQFPVAVRTILPERTKENYAILYARLLDTNPRNNNSTVDIKITDMVAALQTFQRGPADGYVVVVDTEGCSFGQIFRINMGLTRRYLSYLQEGLPVRLKSIHIINANAFAEKAFYLVKPLLKQHVKEMIYVHVGMEGLFETVPQELLPLELGGRQGSFKDLNAAALKTLTENVDFFSKDDALRTDLSLVK